MTTPASEPTKPGWYECRVHDCPKDRLVVRWWDGNDLFFSRRESDLCDRTHFTDFIGPLVPAREPGEREREGWDENRWSRYCGTVFACIVGELMQIRFLHVVWESLDARERNAACQKCTEILMQDFGIPANGVPAKPAILTESAATVAGGEERLRRKVKEHLNKNRDIHDIHPGKYVEGYIDSLDLVLRWMNDIWPAATPAEQPEGRE